MAWLLGCLRSFTGSFRVLYSPWALLAQARLIDTHYGAIAAKAVKLKPKDLVVQEKAQEEFEKMLPGQWP